MWLRTVLAVSVDSVYDYSTFDTLCISIAAMYIEIQYKDFFFNENLNY